MAPFWKTLGALFLFCSFQGKRTHGHGQQGGGCRGEGRIKGINGTWKKIQLKKKRTGGVCGRGTSLTKLHQNPKATQLTLCPFKECSSVTFTWEGAMGGGQDREATAIFLDPQYELLPEGLLFLGRFSVTQPSGPSPCKSWCPEAQPARSDATPRKSWGWFPKWVSKLYK